MERRFFCPSIPTLAEPVDLPDDESHHLRTVLRGRVGDEIMLLDGKGVIATAAITDLGGRRQPVVCTVLSHELVSQPEVQLRLFVAPPRGKGMAGIVRGATELGVNRITPIITERATSKPEKSALASWDAAAITAIKQAINPFCPEIDPPMPLSDALNQDVTPGYVGWIPDTQPPAVDVIQGPSEVSLFIGPEGGFTDEELDAIFAKGIMPVSFGPYVLRVETAVLAGIAWLNQRFRIHDE